MEAHSQLHDFLQLKRCKLHTQLDWGWPGPRYARAVRGRGGSAVRRPGLRCGRYRELRDGLQPRRSPFLAHGEPFCRSPGGTLGAVTPQMPLCPNNRLQPGSATPERGGRARGAEGRALSTASLSYAAPLRAPSAKPGGRDEARRRHRWEAVAGPGRGGRAEGSIGRPAGTSGPGAEPGAAPRRGAAGGARPLFPAPAAGRPGPRAAAGCACAGTLPAARAAAARPPRERAWQAGELRRSRRAPVVVSPRPAGGRERGRERAGGSGRAPSVSPSAARHVVPQPAPSGSQAVWARTSRPSAHRWARRGARPGGLGASPREAPRGAEELRAAARWRPRRCFGDGAAASEETRDEAPERPNAAGLLLAAGPRRPRPARRGAAEPPRPGLPGPRGEGGQRPGGAEWCRRTIVRRARARPGSSSGPAARPARLGRGAACPFVGPAPPPPRFVRAGQQRRRSAWPRRRGEPGGGLRAGGRLCRRRLCRRHGRLHASSGPAWAARGADFCLAVRV